jgi:ABC-2 type transport system permease protein
MRRPQHDDRVHALDRSLVGVDFAQLILGVLGVLVISGEYSTGMIRSTFTAVPKRLPVLWAKAGVFGAVTLTLAAPAMIIAFLAAQASFKGHTANGHDVSLSLSSHDVLRALLGGALYLTLCGLLGLGLGAILRNTAAGISLFAGLLFVLPPLLGVLPTSWNNAVFPYLPAKAGAAILQTGHPAHTLAPWTGLSVFAGYVIITLAVAAALLKHRDV